MAEKGGVVAFVSVRFDSDRSVVYLGAREAVRDRHTETQRYTETDKQTEADTDKHRDRDGHRDKQTDRY